LSSTSGPRGRDAGRDADEDGRGRVVTSVVDGADGTADGGCSLTEAPPTDELTRVVECGPDPPELHAATTAATASRPNELDTNRTAPLCHVSTSARQPVSPSPSPAAVERRSRIAEQIADQDG
jgi:hypothetical protein